MGRAFVKPRKGQQFGPHEPEEKLKAAIRYVRKFAQAHITLARAKASGMNSAALTRPKA